MKLFAFLSCLGDPVHPPVQSTPRPLQETTSSAPRDGGRHRRGRNGIAWRPSLGSIGENSRPTVGPAGRPVRSGKEPAGKKRSRAEIRPRSSKDRFGSPASVASVPAFNPTAFLF